MPNALLEVFGVTMQIFLWEREGGREGERGREREREGGREGEKERELY